MWITIGNYLSVVYFIMMDENIIYDSESYGTFFDDTTSKTSLLNERYVLILCYPYIVRVISLWG